MVGWWHVRAWVLFELAYFLPRLPARALLRPAAEAFLARLAVLVFLPATFFTLVPALPVARLPPLPAAAFLPVLPPAAAAFLPVLPALPAFLPALPATLP